MEKKVNSKIAAQRAAGKQAVKSAKKTANSEVDWKTGIKVDADLLYVEAVCACDGIARSNVPVDNVVDSFVKRGSPVTPSLLRNVVQSAREHHAEWDNHVTKGTPHVLSLCPYKHSTVEGDVFVIAYTRPYLSAVEIRGMVGEMSLDEIRRIMSEASEKRTAQCQAGLFTISDADRRRALAEKKRRKAISDSISAHGWSSVASPVSVPFSSQ